MTDEDGFLSDLMSRPWSPDAKHGFRPAGLFVGKGANALEVVVAHSSSRLTRAALLESWKVRRGGCAAPVLLVVLHPGGAALCGASGEAPPVYPKIGPGQVERLCREVLDQPDRRTALAVMLRESESPEAGTARFNSLLPVSYALTRADAENLPWVVLVRGKSKCPTPSLEETYPSAKSSATRSLRHAGNAIF